MIPPCHVPFFEEGKKFGNPSMWDHWVLKELLVVKGYTVNAWFLLILSRCL